MKRFVLVRGLTAFLIALLSPLAAVSLADAPDIALNKEVDEPDASPRAAGGPNTFGYTFIDSLEAGGPAFSFIDITATGTQVSYFDADALPAQNANADDGVALAISLAGLNGGQGFPFFGVLRTEVNMSTNGFLHFDLNGTSDALANNCPIQNATEPNNMIAVMWDDLVLRNPPSTLAGGFVEVFSPCPYSEGGTGDCVVFQWDNCDHFGGGIDSFDFQAVLYDSGNILMLYPEGAGATPANPPFNPEHGSGSTTGIENGDASDSLDYACDTNNSLPADHAVLFTYPLPRAILTKTVAACEPDPGGTDPSCKETCGGDVEILVTPASDVRYCYTITNVGTTPINSHTLVDDDLGTITLPVASLAAGASTTVTVRDTITQDVVGTATYQGTLGSLTITRTAPTTVRLDTDEDTIPDAEDNCIDDANTNQADADGDGLGNVCDNCVNVSNADQADDDGDTVGDACDNCIEDDNLDQADADNDNTGDDCDECDDDPDKTAEGVCGCGVADTDTDSDGTADCIDGCVDDPGKTAEGVCGCGTVDTDTDADGTADCLDECDDDAAKTEEGVCGCGVADVDEDADDIIDCIDNCPNDANADQADADGDGAGDACDPNAGQNGDFCAPVSAATMSLTLCIMPFARRSSHRRRTLRFAHSTR